MRCNLVRCLLAILLTVPFGFARGEGLTGVKGIRVVVEQIDDDAKQCGLSREALDAASRLVIGNSRLPVVTGVGTPYFYIRVTVLRAGPQCVGTIHVSLNRLVWLTSGGPDAVMAGVWEDSRTMLLPQNAFRRELLVQLEDLTKLFMAAWQREN